LLQNYGQKFLKFNEYRMLKTEKGDAPNLNLAMRCCCLYAQLREAVKFLGTMDRQHEAPGKMIGLQDEGPCVEESWIAILKQVAFQIVYNL
jgi:hypothetical protein